MEIKLDQTIYELTEDNNIVYQYNLQRSEVNINHLEKQIKNLQSEIDNTPIEKTITEIMTDSVKEAINFWNSINVIDTTDLILIKGQKEKIMTNIRSLE